MPGPKPPYLDGALQVMLRRDLEETSRTWVEIADKTGISVATLGRFLRREQTLRLDKAEALAAYFGIRFSRAG